MNKKTVVIHQPDFAPYLGFFHRFLHADFYIALDHIQFVYGSRAWTHRDKIKTAQGEKWMTVSVKKAPRDTAINQVELSSDTDWRTQNLSLLEKNYRMAPCYNELMPKIEQLYARPGQMLCDFTIGSIEMLMDLLDVRIPWVWSSSISGRTSWTRWANWHRTCATSGSAVSTAASSMVTQCPFACMK